MKTLFLIAALLQLPALPSELTTATTITIVNGGVNQDDLDKITLELTKWGRFHVRPTDQGSEEGELQLVVTREVLVGSPMSTLIAGVPIRIPLFRLSFQIGDKILYSDQTRGGIRKTLERMQKRLK